MLNMAEYLKKFMPGESLFEHIWNNKGGDSLAFLESILQQKPHPKDFKTVALENLLFVDMSEHLRNFGPGLVSGFSVAERFTSDDWQHLGEYEVDKFKGRHAMVLVGYRVVSGKTHYLLQNWWKSKPYVEVDSEYLLCSEASVHFVTKRQEQMGDYPTSLEELVECDVGMDASENFMPEGQFFLN
jgi:hypothetical protein